MLSFFSIILPQVATFPSLITGDIPVKALFSSDEENSPRVRNSCIVTRERWLGQAQRLQSTILKETSSEIKVSDRSILGFR